MEIIEQINGARMGGNQILASNFKSYYGDFIIIEYCSGLANVVEFSSKTKIYFISLFKTKLNRKFAIINFL